MTGGEEGTNLKGGQLTDEEHHARAMLLGMRYHHGNGEPFYFNEGALDVRLFLDANTLKPILSLPEIEVMQDQFDVPSDRVFGAVKDATFTVLMEKVQKK